MEFSRKIVPPEIDPCRWQRDDQDRNRHQSMR